MKTLDKFARSNMKHQRNILLHGGLLWARPPHLQGMGMSFVFYLQCRRPWFDSWVRKILWRRDRLPTPVFLGFPFGSTGKEPAWVRMLQLKSLHATTKTRYSQIKQTNKKSTPQNIQGVSKWVPGAQGWDLGCELSAPRFRLFATRRTVARQASVHGIFQARILEWVAISSSNGSSPPRDQTYVSCFFCTCRQILYHCTTWEALGESERK